MILRLFSKSEDSKVVSRNRSPFNLKTFFIVKRIMLCDFYQNKACFSRNLIFFLQFLFSPSLTNFDCPTSFLQRQTDADSGCQIPVTVKRQCYHSSRPLLLLLQCCHYCQLISGVTSVLPTVVSVSYCCHINELVYCLSWCVEIRIFISIVIPFVFLHFDDLVVNVRTPTCLLPWHMFFPMFIMELLYGCYYVCVSLIIIFNIYPPPFRLWINFVYVRIKLIWI